MQEFTNLNMAGATVFLCQIRKLMKLLNCSFIRLAVALFSLIGTVGIAASCTTLSKESSASVPPLPLDDKAYAPILEKWSREANVLEKFQKQVDVHAVLFTDEMRRAYAERFARLRGKADAQIEDIGDNKLGLVVSVFTPSTDFLDLDNALLWSLSVRWGAQQIEKPLIRKLKNKTPFEAFFPFVNHWSQDYLVVFDSREQLGNSILANPQSVTLSLRSALANVELTWK